MSPSNVAKTVNLATARLHSEIDNLSRINRELTSLTAERANAVEYIKAELKRQRIKTTSTQLGVVATLFQQLRTDVDREKMKRYLTPRQLRAVMKVTKLTVLKVTP